MTGQIKNSYFKPWGHKLPPLRFFCFLSSTFLIYQDQTAWSTLYTCLVYFRYGPAYDHCRTVCRSPEYVHASSDHTPSGISRPRAVLWKHVAMCSSANVMKYSGFGDFFDELKGKICIKYMNIYTYIITYLNKRCQALFTALKLSPYLSRKIIRTSTLLGQLHFDFSQEHLVRSSRQFWTPGLSDGFHSNCPCQSVYPSVVRPSVRPSLNISGNHSLVSPETLHEVRGQ